VPFLFLELKEGEKSKRHSFRSDFYFIAEKKEQLSFVKTMWLEEWPVKQYQLTC